jgi:hypothetical protein
MPNDCSTINTKGDEPTLLDLVQAINDASPQDPLQAKRLHQEVFEHEQAYLEQSQLFQ